MLSKLKYFMISLVSAVLLLQLYIGFIADGEIDTFSRILLVTIIVGAFLFRFINRRTTFGIAYLDFFIHAITFLIVNLSFWIHAALVLMQDSDRNFSGGWMGLIVIMPAMWGIGLFIEAITTFWSKACKVSYK